MMVIRKGVPVRHSRLVSLPVVLCALSIAACSQPSDPVASGASDAAIPAASEPADTAAVEGIGARAVADASRPEEDRLLDVSRHPAEVLTFAGVQPGWRVADLTAGAGYYSRVLSTAVGESGHVFSHNPSWVAERFPEPNMALSELAAQRANMTHMVTPVELFSADIAEPLDAVFMVLFYHDTTYDGTDRAAMNAAIFEALRPGGVFLVIDHHAPEGSGTEHGETTHRVDAALVREEVLAAGFELAGESDMLSNRDDPRDISVFDASIRRNTDRFVFLFRKPA